MLKEISYAKALWDDAFQQAGLNCSTGVELVMSCVRGAFHQHFRHRIVATMYKAGKLPKGRSLVLLRISILITVYASGETCREHLLEVGNSTDYAKIVKLLRESMDFSADPCEDFYQFACGKWIENIPEPDTKYNRRSVMYEDLLKKNQAMLGSKEFGDSRAMTSAQRFHEKCVSSDEEWKSKGGSINFVMRNIRKVWSSKLLKEIQEAPIATMSPRPVGSTVHRYSKFFSDDRIFE
ncbi:hypothetical protein Y032_0055g2631 [Ancylostoma ceylanicum]|uniref:Peptidase M13 N-terminal domain-containing protein n=1 Tax=Ancylostoma ceylanicum TaxID=53326 RepID=A0A016U7N2_9BILA|nr:hypothetical protein Y032_0055g2631 [Ancylostoma ceylanicum]